MNIRIYVVGLWGAMDRIYSEMRRSWCYVVLRSVLAVGGYALRGCESGVGDVSFRAKFAELGMLRHEPNLVYDCQGQYCCVSLDVLYYSRRQ